LKEAQSFAKVISFLVLLVFGDDFLVDFLCLPNRFALLVIGFFLIHGGCSTTADIPSENQKAMQEYWTLYIRGSPDWPEARQKWFALGALERKCLVNALIQEMQKKAVKPRMNRDGKPEPGWVRPVEELQSIGEEALYPLLHALERVKDETVVLPCIEALARIATLEDLEEALAEHYDEDFADFQCRLLKVLVRLEDPQALRVILNTLTQPYAWQVRATAADVLKGYEGPLYQEVIRGLKAAEKDKDPFVASKVKEALETLEQNASQNR
jgi:hypothetical protein